MPPMRSPNILRLGVGNGLPKTREPFTLGIVRVDVAEPFDIARAPIVVDLTELFYVRGKVGANLAEPFNLGVNVRVDVAEPFAIDGASAGGYLGPGSPASPTMGHWES